VSTAQEALSALEALEGSLPESQRPGWAMHEWVWHIRKFIESASQPAQPKPVASSEALEALEWMSLNANFYSCNGVRLIDKVDVVRSALEASAQEAEDWAAIEAWRAAGLMHRDWSLTRDARPYEITLYDVAVEEGKEFNAPTRQAAIALAAAWAREELKEGTR